MTFDKIFKNTKKIGRVSTPHYINGINSEHRVPKLSGHQARSNRVAYSAPNLACRRREN